MQILEIMRKNKKMRPQRIKTSIVKILLTFNKHTKYFLMNYQDNNMTQGLLIILQATRVAEKTVQILIPKIIINKRIINIETPAKNNFQILREVTDSGIQLNSSMSFFKRDEINGKNNTKKKRHNI